MKLITRDTDYAVRALCYIAKSKNRVIPVTEMVKELRIPRPFLRKLLQLLNKKGMLKSQKGSGGGFALAMPAREIFLADLVEIFQGELKINECLFKNRACPNRRVCNLKRQLDAVEKRVIAELRPITIESLLCRKGR